MYYLFMAEVISLTKGDFIENLIKKTPLQNKQENFLYDQETDV